MKFLLKTEKKNLNQSIEDTKMLLRAKSREYSNTMEVSSGKNNELKNRLKLVAQSKNILEDLIQVDVKKNEIFNTVKNQQINKINSLKVKQSFANGGGMK
jgi:hypothetical protein